MTIPAPPPTILRRGPALPATPLVIAVPHAGRRYPDELRSLSRLTETQLAVLEDRHADRLVDDAVAAGAVALIAQAPRAWIDLNRDPLELDPAMIADPGAARWRESARVRSGLGLIPRRTAAGAIWRAPLAMRDVAGRIAGVHRPWHAAIAAALDAAQARFGHALLIDCHTMPPLDQPQPPRIVLGDRFGASAGRPIVEAMMRAALGHGHAAALNRPYAGGYTLEQHGRPSRGRHAVQVELCRSLYLDARLDAPGPGLAAARALLAALVRAGVDALGGWIDEPIAAE